MQVWVIAAAALGGFVLGCGWVLLLARHYSPGVVQRSFDEMLAVLAAQPRTRHLTVKQVKDLRDEERQR